MKMETLIERVARAIAKTRIASRPNLSELQRSKLLEAMWPAHVAVALIVLQSIRDPNGWMVTAGRDIDYAAQVLDDPTGSNAVSIWRAMIDAALYESTFVQIEQLARLVSG
jgi:hypothetical protein